MDQFSIGASMRRSLLTAGRSLLPFSVGNPIVSGNSFGSGGFLVVLAGNPSPKTGILDTVNYYSATGYSIYAVVASLNGTVATIKQMSGSLPGGTGMTRSQPVTLSINTSECIGFWSVTGGNTCVASTAATGISTLYAQVSSMPTVGTEYTLDRSSTSIKLSYNASGIGS